jgi:two-component system, NarL family, sensor histidine kinase DegS
MLTDLGVAPTVRRYIERFGEKNDIETKLELVSENRRLERHREVLIFRSIQEVMSLARDYSTPTEINARLDMTGDKVKMQVQDNGRGFDATNIFDASRGDTDNARVQALNMLKNKLELVGGTIEVRSNENEGTTVRMELPAGDTV